MPEPADERPSPLQHALTLAAEGFYVFPCIENGRLPAVSAWQHRATRDPDTIRKMWTSYDPVLEVLRERDFNIGIFTGRFGTDQHLVVLDVDMKNGKDGEESLSSLDMLDGTPNWLETRQHRTPSGGRHFLYVSDTGAASTTSRLGKGLDTRGEGGFIVAPGSTIDGRSYTVEDPAPLRTAPSWFVAKIGRPIDRGAATSVVELLDTAPAMDRARDFLKTAEPAVEGAGGDAHTFEVACKVGDFGVSELACLELMLDWNAKCEPPWDYEALAVKVANAYAYRKRPLGEKDATADFEPITDDEDVEAKEPVNGLPLEYFGSIAVDFTRTALIDGWLDEQAMSVLYGESNVGKTFVAMSQSFAVASGRQWAGRDVQQGGVVYLAAEAGNSARKRMIALQRKYGATDLPFALIPSPVDLLKSPNDWKAVVKAVQDFEEATGRKCLLLVIDTLSRVLAGGNENAPDDMGKIVKNLDRIRNATKAHLMVVHHSGKDKARGARGHSLLRAATDTEIEVGDNVVRSTKQRDMESAKPVPFSLESVEIGTDTKGVPVTSAVAVMMKASAEEDFADMNLTPGEQECLDALATALQEHGKELQGQVVVDGKAWRKCYEMSNPSENADAMWRKHRTALQKKLAVDEIVKNQWLIS